MLRVFVYIKFDQQATTTFPSRKQSLLFEFCHEYEVNSTWDTLTDDGMITLPKNVVIKDKNGRQYSLNTNAVNLGGFSDATPVFLKGDKVSIVSGYAFYDESGRENIAQNNIFSGYISEVTSKKPFVIKIEDDMFILKRTQAVGQNNRKFFSGKTYTLESMLTEMFQAAGLKYTVSDLTQTRIGDFIVGNETIAEVLARIRKDFNFKSYFRGTELRVGASVYVEQDAIDSGVKRFHFQKNIIEDNLDYQRKDDLTISTVATNISEEKSGELTKYGNEKVKKSRLEVLITLRAGSETPTYFVGSKTTPIPSNTEGQRFTDHFYGAKNIEELKTWGLANLKLRYYTGYKGKFTTFGMPHVQIGDNVDLIDGLLPERNGRYKVKSVKYTGGVGGLRQEIELDYLITRLDSNGRVI